MRPPRSAQLPSIAVLIASCLALACSDAADSPANDAQDAAALHDAGADSHVAPATDAATTDSATSSTTDAATDAASDSTADASTDAAADADAAIDPDSDADGIDDVLELGPDPSQPLDTDGDKTPDYLDDDSDGDGVLDVDEGAGDFDTDGTPNFRDEDSDDDCRADQAEAAATPPVDSDGDGHPDFLDRDSDGDLLADQTEDANCNAVADGSETDALLADTDSDGVSDLVETAVATNPRDANDNPTANGDLVLLADGSTSTSELAFVPTLSKVDLYVILDRSGSMTSEITSVKNNLATVVSNLKCMPAGNGTPPNCLTDLWAGAGTVGYSGTGGAAFTNHVDVQPNPSFTAIPTTEPIGCCSEPLTFATWAAITGLGSADATGCTLPSVAPRATCAGSPAANAGHPTFGYPCLRADALTLIMLATDEEPLTQGNTYECPAWPTVVKPAYNSRSAKLIGIVGSGAPANVTSDLQQMATDTGAVDATNAAAPLVFSGADANAATAIQTGVTSFIAGAPLDLAVAITDDAADAVDAVASFVSGLTTRQTGTASCTSGLTELGATYVGVPNKTPVCWNLESKPNTSVAPTASTQVFAARATVTANGVTEVAARDVYFVVPPLAP